MALRILVVEDEEELRALLADMLEAMDHQVDTAGTGQAALGLLAVESYEVILTDFRMEGMDGYDLFRRIRQQWPHLARRVAFVTGQETVDVGDEEASVPILTKPYSFDGLRDVIAMVLARNDA